MRSWWPPLVAGVLLVGWPVVAAQDRPNFSGEWVRVDPPQNPPAVLTIEQTDQFIEIRPLSLSGPRPGKYRFDSFEGGAAATTGTGGVSLRSSSVVWKDTSFVVTEERSITQDGNMTHQSRHEEVWSIQGKKLLVVVITDEETGTAPTRTRFVYRSRSIVASFRSVLD